MKKNIILFIGIFCLNYGSVSSQNYYAIDTIQKIEIFFSQTNWDYILDTAKQGSDSYTLAQWVKINGVYFDSVGVKYKGNSSYKPSNAKNPLHIELNHFKDQNYMGLKDIKLSNGYHEPTFIREALSYAILQNYMPVSNANFAQVYINNEAFGLYTNVEVVTKTFLEKRFYSNDNPFFFMDNGGCNLVYKGSDTTLYYMPYTLKSDYGWTDLANLCFTLKNNISNIENVLNVDRSLWMLAFTNVTVTLDSYLGQSTHNYYLYEDHNGRFNPIIWDLNGGFGIFNKVNGNVQLNVPQMQTMSPLLHSGDSLWPLVSKLLAVPLYKRMYIAHVRTIINENFADSSYFTYAQYLQSLIDTAVQSDTKKFYTHSQFLSNMTSTVIDGPKTIPGLTELMNTRTIFLNSTAELQNIPPVIIAIQTSNPYPPLNSAFYITAEVSDAASVYLGIRNSVMDKFSRIMMYDDGSHGDGLSGDGIYGVSVNMTDLQMQYFVYAENNNAGIFSPERAENEFYTLTSSFNYISAGTIVINEIMAVNNTTAQLPNGQYGDWVELYNNSTDSVSLDFLNLSDDLLNPGKWQFPSGTIIPPHSFLIVWAENGNISGEYLCGFNFSGNGEQAILSYTGGNVVDSINYPLQTADISWGRYPNGTGAFGIMTPTFNATNSSTGIKENLKNNRRFLIYPNPAKQIINVEIQGSRSDSCEFVIFDFLGKEHLRKTLYNNFETFEINLSGGMYFFMIKDNMQILTSGKLLIQ